MLSQSTSIKTWYVFATDLGSTCRQSVFAVQPRNEFSLIEVTHREHRVIGGFLALLATSLRRGGWGGRGFHCSLARVVNLIPPLEQEQLVVLLVESRSCILQGRALGDNDKCRGRMESTIDDVGEHFDYKEPQSKDAVRETARFGITY